MSSKTGRIAVEGPILPIQYVQKAMDGPLKSDLLLQLSHKQTDIQAGLHWSDTQEWAVEEAFCTYISHFYFECFDVIRKAGRTAPGLCHSMCTAISKAMKSGEVSCNVKLKNAYSYQCFMRNTFSSISKSCIEGNRKKSHCTLKWTVKQLSTPIYLLPLELQVIECFSTFYNTKYNGIRVFKSVWKL